MAMEAASRPARMGARAATATAMPMATTATDGPVSRSVRCVAVIPSHDACPVTTPAWATTFTSTCVETAMARVRRVPMNASASATTITTCASAPHTGRRGAGATSERGLRAIARQTGCERRTALSASSTRPDRAERRMISAATMRTGATMLSGYARQPCSRQRERT